MTINHKETLWKILTKTSPQEEVFTTTKSIENGDDLTILQIPHYAGLQPEKDYVVECIHVADNGLKSEPGTITFTPVGSSIQPPVISYPTNNSNFELGNDLVIQASVLISIPAGMPHTATDWRIGTINNPESLQKNESATNLTSYTVTKTFFNENTKYYLFCRYKSGDIYSPWSTGVTINTSAIQVVINRPSITAPANGSTVNGVNETILTSSAFSATGGATHIATTWQISKDSTFSSFLVNTTNGTNLVSYTVPANTFTDNGVVYYARIKYRGSTGESDWSMPITFTNTITVTDPIAQPIILTPSSGASLQKEAITITTSNFQPNNQIAATHTSTQWQVSTDMNFSSIAWQSDSTVNKTSVQVPSTSLTDGTNYFTRAKHKSGSYSSEWSTVVNFSTTEAAKIMPITIISPSANFQLSISNSLNIIASDFNGKGGATFTISSFQIASDSGFSNIVWSTMKSNPASTSATVPANTLQANLTYYIRVGYYSGVGDLREWAQPVIIQTTEGISEAFINTPNITAPSSGVTLDNATINNLIGSSFSASNGITMKSMHWQISGDSGFSSLIYNQEIPSNGNTTQTLPASTLMAGSNYWVRLKYYGTAPNSSGSVSSNWSGTVQFTTRAANYSIQTPSILSPMNGTLIPQNTPTTIRITDFNGTSGVSPLQSCWEIADNANFSGNVSRPTVTSNISTYTVNLTSTFGSTGKMYIRAKYQGIVNGNSSNIIDSTYSTAMEYQVSTGENYKIDTPLQPVINNAETSSQLANEKEYVFQCSAPSGTSGINFIKSVWQISDNLNFTGFMQEHEVTDSPYYYRFTFDKDVAYGTTGRLFGRMKHVGIINGDASRTVESAWSAVSLGYYCRLVGNKPTIQSPNPNQNINPTIANTFTAAYSNISGFTTSEWRISTDPNFTIEANSTFIYGTCSANTCQGTLNANNTYLVNNQTYYIRVKAFNGQISSSWSDVISFRAQTSGEEYTINQPTITYQVSGSGSYTVNFTGSTYSGSQPLTFFSSYQGTWQFADNENFTGSVSQIVRTSTSYNTCPMGPFSSNAQITKPYARVRYEVVKNGTTYTSLWSNPIHYDLTSVVNPINKPSITNIVGTKTSGLTITVSPWSCTDATITHTTTTISFNTMAVSLSKQASNVYTLSSSQIASLVAGTQYQFKVQYYGVSGTTGKASDWSENYNFTLTAASELKPYAPTFTRMDDYVTSDNVGNINILKWTGNDSYILPRFNETNLWIDFAKMTGNSSFVTANPSVAQVKFEVANNASFTGATTQLLNSAEYGSGWVNYLHCKFDCSSFSNTGSIYYVRAAVLPATVPNYTSTWSDWSVTLKLYSKRFINNPTITYPTNGAAIPLNQSVQVAGSSISATETCTPDYSLWQTSVNNLGTSGITSKNNYSTSGANWTKSNAIGPYSAYTQITYPYMRVMYAAKPQSLGGTITVYSGWSTYVDVRGTTSQYLINTPTITSPVNNSTHSIGTNLTYTASAFSGSSGVTALQAVWHFSNDEAFSSVAQITRTVADYGVSGISSFPSGALNSAQTKYMRVRYVGYHSGNTSNTVQSEWSNTIKYTIGSSQIVGPTITSPNSPTVVAFDRSQNVTLSSVPTGKTATQIVFQASTNSSFTSSLRSAAVTCTNNNTSVSIPPNFINANNWWFVRAKFTFNDGTESDWGTYQQWYTQLNTDSYSLIFPAAIITSPAADGTNIGSSGNVTFTANIVGNGKNFFNGADIPTSLYTTVGTQWQFCANSTFSSNVYTVTSTTTSLTVNIASISSYSYVRVSGRYLWGSSTNITISPLMSFHNTPRSYTVGAAVTLNTPSWSYPLSGATINPTVVLNLQVGNWGCSNLAALNQNSVYCAWEISKYSTFSTMAYNTPSQIQALSLTVGNQAFSLPANTLEAGTTYYLRMRFKANLASDGTTIYSNYTPTNTITTSSTSASIAAPTISVSGNKSTGLTITTTGYNPSITACAFNKFTVTVGTLTFNFTTNTTSYSLTAAQISSLADNTAYSVTARFYGTYSGSTITGAISNTVVITFATGSITAPNVNMPLGNNLSQFYEDGSYKLNFGTTGFNGSGYTYSGTDWQVSTANTFGTLLLEKSSTVVPPTTYRLGKNDNSMWAANTTYYVRARHKGTNAAGTVQYSGWSSTVAFTVAAITASATFNAPVINIPTSGATFNVATTPITVAAITYTGTPQPTIDGYTVEVATNSSFTAGLKTALFVNGSTTQFNSAFTLDLASQITGLTSNTTYYMRMKIHGKSNGVNINSTTSATRTFITPTTTTTCTINTPTVNTSNISGTKSNGLTFSNLSAFGYTATSGTCTHTKTYITYGGSKYTFNAASSYTITSTQLASLTAGSSYSVIIQYEGNHSTLGTILSNNSPSINHTLTDSTVTINTPTISSPVTGATGVGLASNVTLSAFSSNTSTWYTKSVIMAASTSSSFPATSATKEATFTHSSSNTYSLNSLGLAAGTLYYFKFRYAGTTAAGASAIYSNWCTHISFTTSAGITKPWFVLPPANSSFRADEASTLMFSTFSATGVTQGGFNIQISTVSTFATTVVDRTIVSSDGYTYTLAANTLSNNTNYYCRVRYYGTVSGAVQYSDWSDARAFSTTAAITVISKPSVSSVVYTGDSGTTPGMWSLTTSNYALTSGTGAHTSTVMQIGSSSSFGTIVYSFTQTSSTQLTKCNIATLNPPDTALKKGTTYYIRVKHKSGTYESDWSNSYTWTCNQGIVITPTVTSPSANTSYMLNSISSITITASNYAATGGMAFSKMEIQSATNSTFTTGVGSAFVTSLTSGAGVYTVAKTYLTKGTFYFRLRYIASDGTMSNWSATRTITIT